MNKYLYAVMILNEEDKEINEENITALLQSVNIKVESSKVKSVVAAMEEISLNRLISEELQD